MSIHSHLPFDQSTSHARVPAGGIHPIASIDSASEAQVTASFFGSTKALHGEVAIPSAETSTHNHSNQQYSITAVTTSAGAIAERYAYSAYGEPTVLNASGSTLASSAINNRYSYTGREWDATVGLYHFRARWMSPKTGRFLGRDPIDYDGSQWSMYEYCTAKVFRFTDPLGLFQTVPNRPKITGIPDQCPCCCCPSSITATSTVVTNSSGVFRYTQALDITFTISMTYSKAPQGAKNTVCQLGFGEFVDPESTDSLVPRGMTEGSWIDQVAAKPRNFDKWRDFDPPQQKSCSGTATITLTDHSKATPKGGELLRFWQIVGVLGGKDCKCKPTYKAVLTKVTYDPNQASGTAPTMVSYPLPVSPRPTAPQGVFPLPTW